MSTATNISAATKFARRGKTMFWRIVWKEFRMLRSLWAAVAIMGLLVQWTEKMLLPGGSDFVLTLFCTGLAFAVLYAAGAAATTFSVEHEEETYDLLTRLPTTWWPPFAGKLAVTLLSALLLGTALLISALIFGSRYFISGQDARLAIGMLGFAIIEAIAWGTLFSLLIKRPLLAAIVTLVVGAVTVNIAVSYSSTYAIATLTPEAYVHALPLRAAIVVAVIACSVFVARGWLTAGTGPGMTARLPKENRLVTWLVGGRSRTHRVKAVADRAPRRRMLARLLWQTWRESWKLLLAPLGVALLLFAGTGAALGLTRAFNEVGSLMISSALLCTPALYGAMAFYSDQRRDNYRFLAEHAARPRFIWLARHIVWLGTFIGLWLLFLIGFAALAWHQREFNNRQSFQYYLDWGMHPNATTIIYYFALGAEAVVSVLLGASFGGLVAFGVGQFFSMAIRSEILAAFVALILTSVVAAWVYVILLWQLSAALFLIPLFVGLMLATWFRAPDWIAGRNTWRAWLKPVLAIIAPPLLIAAMLPAARLAQIQPKPPSFQGQVMLPKEVFAERLAAFQAGDTTAAAQTADMYIRAAEKLAGGTSPDPLARWRRNGYEGQDGEIIAANIPASERPALRQALMKHVEYIASIEKQLATAVEEAIEISKRPTCRFHFDPASLAPSPPSTPNERLVGLAANRSYQNVSQLISAVAGQPMSTPDQPARRLLAALKMEKHLRSGQPSAVIISALRGENFILQRITEWALEKDRTKEELRDLLDNLNVQLHSPEPPAESLIADRMLIRDVILGKDLPFILSTSPVEPHAYLAYLANDLWWERERALTVLDQITRFNLFDMDDLADKLNDTTPREIGNGVLRHWLRPDYGGLPDTWQIQNPAAVTSYLASLEYKARVPISELSRAYCDNAVIRNATLIEIALVLYHLDHKKYPAQLSDLAPDYLEQLPLDPYARQSFQYQRVGLDLKLKYWSPDHQYKFVDPHTPFFWSVGPGNVTLREVTEGSPFFGGNDDPTPIGEEPIPNKFEPQYVFINEESGWNLATPAFPLPK
jgi:hypothetical protein